MYAFAATHVTDARLTQCINELGLENLSMKDTADVMRWMTADVEKETQLERQESGMTWDDVRKTVGSYTVNKWKVRVNDGISS